MARKLLPGLRKVERPAAIDGEELGGNQYINPRFQAWAQSHSRFSFTRAPTIFFTSASGNGLSGGK